MGCYEEMQRDVVTQRATYDLHCPHDQLHVDQLVEGTFVARGCNNEATYDCTLVHTFGDSHYVCAKER